MIKILFIGVVGSKKFISELINEKRGTPNPAAQKFFRLLLEGLAFNDQKLKTKVDLICLPEINNSHKTEYFTESFSSLVYYYLPSYSSLKRRFINFFESYKIVKVWSRSEEKKKFIVYDPLHITSSLYAVIFSFLFRVKKIAIITDIPKYMNILKVKVSFIDFLIEKIRNELILSADFHIILTEGIADYFSFEKGKYIVIEGVVDNDFPYDRNVNQHLKIIHYSGGLYEKFGVKMLVDVFKQLKLPNVRLHLFGMGDLENYIAEASVEDKRIQYFGFRANDEILKDQTEAYLLVNPRFSTQEYTKYSFPSKTVEYMLSSVPLVMNRLPGIPEDYFKYCYVFSNESEIGYKETIEKLLNLSIESNIEFGRNASNFILNNKGKYIQGRKIIITISNL